MDEKKRFRRRSILKATPLGLFGSMIATPTSAHSTRNKEFDENLKKVLIEKHGLENGVILYDIISKYTRRLEKGVISEGEYNQRVEEEINSHPKLDDVEEVVKKADERKPEWHKEERNSRGKRGSNGLFKPSGRNIPSLSSVQSTNTHSTSGMGISLLDDANMDGGSSYGGTYDYDFTSMPNRCRSKTAAYAYGSAWSYVRQSCLMIPPSSSGSYRFSLTYDRDGDATAGEAKISILLFHYTSLGEIVAVEELRLESIIGSVNGRVRRSATTDLSGNANVGAAVELYTASQTGGGASNSDFYSEGMWAENIELTKI